MSRFLTSLRHAFGFLTGATGRTALPASTAIPPTIRTENDWLTSEYPDAMLRFVQGQVSDRKLRLYAAAGCRLIWHLLTDVRSRGAVEVSERFADGLADREELRAAFALARDAVGTLPSVDSDRDEDFLRAIATYVPAIAAWAAEASVSDEVAITEAWVLFAALRAADDRRAAAVTTRAAQGAAMRDIFYNPFRPKPAINPAWLSWNEGIVRRLAASAYEERLLPSGLLDRTLLAILADALEEAGCQNLEILAHCRSGGQHVRGCWVVDLLLGKT